MRDLVLQFTAYATDCVTHAPLMVFVLVGLVAIVGGIVPGPPIEGVLLGVASVAPDRWLLPLVVFVTACHMLAKTALFLGGRRLGRMLPSASPRRRAQLERACAAIARRPRMQLATLFGSAVAGLPPFYVTTLAFGALALPVRTFVLVGTLGRAIRFGAVVLAPQLVAP